MSKPYNLPRETSLVRIRSQMYRSLRLVRTAQHGTAGRRDRTLAAWALSRKVRFVRVWNRTGVSGAARWSMLRKAARQYREALRRWSDNRNVATGW